MEMPRKTEAVSMKVALSGLAPVGGEGGGRGEGERRQVTCVDPHAAEQGDESLVRGELREQLLSSLSDD
jgi:hypothetical protein